MKSIIMLPVLFLAACETTGNWNEDTIAFSSRKADRRLGAMEGNLRAMEHENDATRAATRSLEGSVIAANTGRAQDRAEADQLRLQIEELDGELASVNQKISEARSASEPNASKLASLEQQSKELRSSLSRKRARLNEIISRR